MEKRLLRIEIAIVLLLLISSYNLISPLLTNKEEATSESQEDLQPLPDDLTKDFLDKTVFKIKTEFNRSNWEELFNVFGEYAKAQLSVEEIEGEFNKLRPAIGDIQSYAYSHYVYEGSGSNAEWFEIHYKCRFDRGKGTIKISTRTVDGVSEVTGVNISLNEL